MDRRPRSPLSLVVRANRDQSPRQVPNAPVAPTSLLSALPPMAAAPAFVREYAALRSRPPWCRRAGICPGFQIHVARREHSPAAAPDRGIG